MPSRTASFPLAFLCYVPHKFNYSLLKIKIRFSINPGWYRYVHGELLTIQLHEQNILAPQPCGIMWPRESLSDPGDQESLSDPCAHFQNPTKVNKQSPHYIVCCANSCFLTTGSAYNLQKGVLFKMQTYQSQQIIQFYICQPVMEVPPEGPCIEANNWAPNGVEITSLGRSVMYEGILFPVKNWTTSLEKLLQLCSNRL